MPHCPFCQCADVIKRGFFKVRGPTQHQRVQRYACKTCGKKFSTQTGTMTYWEKKSHLNQKVFRLLCSGVSQRSCSFILNLHRTTIARKIRRMGHEARTQLAASFTTKPAGKNVVYDEMETFEHSKCKPLSVAIAVEHKTRRIIAVEVASMPSKGPLAAISRKKYGPRRDDRGQALEAMCKKIGAACPAVERLQSDKNPRYPRFMTKHFPAASHETFKGRRACVVGQGELKSGAFDPLFSLNHTCAMFRDRLKRLSRRTWCTTKLASALQDLMSMYAWFHNQWLASRGKKVGI